MHRAYLLAPFDENVFQRCVGVTEHCAALRVVGIVMLHSLAKSGIALMPWIHCTRTTFAASGTLACSRTSRKGQQPWLIASKHHCLRSFAAWFFTSAFPVLRARALLFPRCVYCLSFTTDNEISRMTVLLRTPANGESRRMRRRVLTDGISTSPISCATAASTPSHAPAPPTGDRLGHDGSDYTAIPAGEISIELVDARLNYGEVRDCQRRGKRGWEG